MKYAVPVSSGRMSPHFGHCECFTLFNVDERSKKIVGKNNISSPEYQPGLLPGWLAERSVSFVITGGIGPRVQEIFKQNGIEVVLGTLD